MKTASKEAVVNKLSLACAMRHGIIYQAISNYRMPEQIIMMTPLRHCSFTLLGAKADTFFTSIEAEISLVHNLLYQACRLSGCHHHGR